MAQPVTLGREANSPKSTKFGVWDTLAILAAWLFFCLMLFAVCTAVKNGL